MCEQKTLTRQELYELVWKTPMRHLATQFGLSDVGLAKTCKRHKIPRPPVGYWVKKSHGETVRRVSLPPCDEPALTTITIGGHGEPAVRLRSVNRHLWRAHSSTRNLAGWLRQRSVATTPLSWRSSLLLPHPLVARTREGFIAASKAKTHNREPVAFPWKVDGLCCLGVQSAPVT